MARDAKASEAKTPKRQRQAANDWLGYTFYTQPERRLPVRC
jgi:hypothetical protein